MRDVTNPRIPDKLAQQLHDVCRLFLVSYYPIVNFVTQKKHSQWKFDKDTGYLYCPTTAQVKLSPMIVGNIFVSAQMKGDSGTVSIHIKDQNGAWVSHQDITVVVLEKDHAQDEYVDWVRRTKANNSLLSLKSFQTVIQSLIEVILA